MRPAAFSPSEVTPGHDASSRTSIWHIRGLKLGALSEEGAAIAAPSAFRAGAARALKFWGPASLARLVIGIAGFMTLALLSTTGTSKNP
jgi:hypothetical protein